VYSGLPAQRNLCYKGIGFFINHLPEYKLGATHVAPFFLFEAGL